MHQLLKDLLDRERVARLVDGGVADNLPARAAWDAVQGGAVAGHRDPFVLALDSFEPRFSLGSNLLFYPLMQLAAENSRVGRRMASYVVSFKDVLSPLAVVPTPEQMDWPWSTGSGNSRRTSRSSRRCCPRWRPPPPSPTRGDPWKLGPRLHP
jgi:hypothetical protein